MPVRPILVFLGAMFCAHAVAGDAVAPVERPARIRLFGQNGVALTMYTNARCEDEYDEEIDASGSLSHAFKTLVGKKAENQTIGIPETDSTRNLAERDHLMANPYYQEYPLVPRQPVTLEAQISSGSGWRCVRDVRASFIPEPGVDYEGEMIRDFGKGVCAVAIRRVAPDGQPGPANLSTVPSKCEADAGNAAPLMTVLLASGHAQYRVAGDGADMEELDDDEDSIEDFEEAIEGAIEEASTAPGMKLCIVGTEDAKAGPLASRIPALLAKHAAAVQAIHVDADALQAEWQLTEARPLTLPLAEYYCRSAVGN